MKEVMMILVVGATGMVGSEICQKLTAQGKPVKALVREKSDSGKVERLRSMGVSLVTGDVRDPESIKAACQGALAVISTVSAMPFAYVPGQNDVETVDREGVKNLMDAAKAMGVSRFIYTSFSKNINVDFPLRNAKRAAEQHLKESGLIYTILRPGYFMEVWLSPAVGFDAENGKATIYGSGDQPISWISFQDVAQFAVEALDREEACNTILEIGGPEMLSPHQVIQIHEQASGKTFEMTHVPPEALEAQQAGADDPMQQSFIGLMRCYAAGDPIDMGETLKTFPVKMKTVEEYVMGK
jgi:uncharacterized protein YbjT (DUF2867 family)